MEVTSQDSSQRRGMLNELRAQYLAVSPEGQSDVKSALAFLALLEQHGGDPLCALCSHPESEHAAFGDWCPNPASEDQLFNYSQKFTGRA